MKSICLDANVMIGLLSPDETSRKLEDFANYLLSTYSFIWAPSIVTFEVAHVLSKKENQRLIKGDVVDEILDVFFRLPFVLVWNEAMVQKAMEIKRSGLSSFYDATYVAVAMIKDVPLITDDQEMLKKGKKIYPAIFSTQQWSS